MYLQLFEDILLAVHLHLLYSYIYNLKLRQSSEPDGSFTNQPVIYFNNTRVVCYYFK